MIVHWFIEPVSYGKESAFDIEIPFHNNVVLQGFVARHFDISMKNKNVCKIV